jgi:ATP-dependent Clp protease ATP-binding subunit ClpA
VRIVAYRGGVLERFSEETLRAVGLAREEAVRLGHSRIGTEHLLLGLVADRGTAASDALATAGVTLAACREKVIEALASRASPPATGGENLPYTDRASRALERAGRLSLRVSSEEVGSGHLLVSVLDVEGTAGQVLRGLGVDPESVRQALSSAASSSSEPSNDRSLGPIVVSRTETAETAGTAGTAEEKGGTPRRVTPVCGTCGARLDSSLDHMVVKVGSGDSAARVDIVYCGVCGTAIGTTAAP